MTNKKLIDQRDNTRQQRRFIVERQFKTVFHDQLAAEIAQGEKDFSTTDAKGQIVPGFGFHHQPHCRASATPRFFNFQFLDQMRFQHFTHNLRDTGGCQLRKTRKINTRYRSRLINQPINGARIGLLYLIAVCLTAHFQPLLN